MSEFKVDKIINGNTIKTHPSWHWTNRDDKVFSGHLVIIKGYEINNDNDNEIAFTRLKALLGNDSYVSLFNPQEVNDKADVVRCRVDFNGVDIATYFPEFRDPVPQ